MGTELKSDEGKACMYDGYQTNGMQAFFTSIIFNI